MKFDRVHCLASSPISLPVQEFSETRDLHPQHRFPGLWGSLIVEGSSVAKFISKMWVESLKGNWPIIPLFMGTEKAVAGPVESPKCWAALRLVLAQTRFPSISCIYNFTLHVVQTRLRSILFTLLFLSSPIVPPLLDLWSVHRTTGAN